MRRWRNWQTHYLEVVAPQGIGVQVPSSAPQDKKASLRGWPFVLFSILFRWFERLQQRWDEFRNRRVNVDGVRNQLIACACVHRVEDAVNRLIPADAEDGGTQDPLSLGI